MIYGNAFCYDNIQSVGGLETFFYQLAKKYKDWDITIIYRTADVQQLKRLSKYVRCLKFTGQQIKCKKVFFNYYASMLDYIDADDYYLVIHADYQSLIDQGIKRINQLPHYTKITNYVGVSKLVCDNFTNLMQEPCALSYNPYTKGKVEKVWQFATFSRITEEKGLNEIKLMIEKLKRSGKLWFWYIFTNAKLHFDEPNVVVLKPTFEVESYMKMVDFVIQFTKAEAFCYAVVEALSVGTPVIVSDVPVMKEIGVNNTNGIIVKNDLSNLHMEDIFDKKYEFNYIPPKDNWDKILTKGKTSYIPKKVKTYIVECLPIYKTYNIEDAELGRVPYPGETMEVSEDRLKILLGDNPKHRVYVKIIDEKN